MNKYLLSLLQLVLTGCTLYGSSGRAYNENLINNAAPKQVLVVFHDDVNYTPVYFTEGHEQLVVETLNHLRQLSQFKFAATTKDYTLATLPRLSTFTTDSLQYDGVLIVERHYTHGPNQRVKITLANSNGLPLVTAQHNTFWGESYWLPPSVELATTDAVAGAFRKFSNKMRKLKH